MDLSIDRLVVEAAAKDLDAAHGWKLQADLDAAYSESQELRAEMGPWDNLSKALTAGKIALVLILLASSASSFLEAVEVEGRSDEEIVQIVRQRWNEQFVQKAGENTGKALAIVNALARSWAAQLKSRH